jgi:acyl-coenzyme A synthetase/AMP-(fatty) acid ligase
LEIETEILSHPQVVETAVFGTKDDVFGEIVVAIVVINESTTTNTHDIDAESFLISLKNHLQSRLANYKLPRIYKFMDKIPRNHMGKVLTLTIYYHGDYFYCIYLVCLQSIDKYIYAYTYRYTVPMIIQSSYNVG